METSWYNPLPGYVGWIAIIVLAAIFGYLWYRMRKSKSEQLPSIFWRIPVQGFADVMVPKTYFFIKADGEEVELTTSRGMAERMASQIELARDDLWAKCMDVYGVEKPWIVDKISVSNKAMPEGHKHVRWNMPHGGIVLLLQDDMYYWFTRECHNVFRFLLFGPEYVYNAKDDEDVANIMAVELWIASLYGRRGDD